MGTSRCLMLDLKRVSSASPQHALYDLEDPLLTSVIRSSVEENRAIASLVLDDTRVACGTELARSQALVHVCTDGLVSLSDTRISEESGDALMQVINHGSVHKAGFLTGTTVYALSHDEQLSVHPMNNLEVGNFEPSPINFGDVRPIASCDYAIDILHVNQGNVLILGSNRNKQQVQVIPFTSEHGWALDHANAWYFPGADEEEIIRSFYINEASQTAFSAGEDGILRAFKGVEEEPGPAIPGSKIKRMRDQRYKPY
ncbi:MAG: hypothetical protein Q9160_005130 [Pyrenula sp. 1 TL-2023]